MQHEIAEQVTLAKVPVGAWVRTTPEPREGDDAQLYVETSNPKVDKGRPRKVIGNEQHKGEGTRQLVFSDATRTPPRAGTALIWVYRTTPDGDPVPEPVYPTCPTCGTDAPGCRTKDGAWAPNMHAARRKLMDEAPAAAEDRECGAVTTDDDGEYVCALRAGHQGSHLGVSDEPTPEPAQPVEPEKPAGIGEVLGTDLAEALTAILPMTMDPKDALPMLASVKVESDGDELLFVGTDRYVLGTYVIPWEGGAVDALIEGSGAKDLLAFAKKVKFSKVRLTFREREVEAHDFERTSTYPLLTDVSFPKWRALLPEHQDGDTRFGLNPVLIGRFAKATDARHPEPMTLTLRSPLKPVGISIGERFAGLIMPIRLPSEQRPSVPAYVEPKPEPEVPERRVERDDDGTVRVNGWTGGERDEVTAAGKRVHIAADGEVTEVKPQVSAAPEPKASASSAGGKCSGCKGFGVVRKRGDQAGQPYKTANGAESATANGNSSPCPVCEGAGVTGKAA